MKVLVALLKYDYGKQDRGPSGEKTYFLPALKANSDEVIEFWLEENGFGTNTVTLQSNLLKSARSTQPDLVFMMLMNDEIAHETLDELNTFTKTLNWFCDDQWRFETFTRMTLPHLTYAITTDKFSVSKYLDAGFSNVFLSQWAGGVFPPVGELSSEYMYGVTFVGGRNSTRAWVVAELNRLGIAVDCFGSGWPSGRVTQEQMRSIFSTSMINLNLSNSVPADASFRGFLWKEFFRGIVSIEVKNWSRYVRRAGSIIREIFTKYGNSKFREQIKARHFEILACGGFQLAKFCIEASDHFENGKEIVEYSTVAELAQLITYFKHNNVEREAIRRAGYNRSREQTYENRIREVFLAIKRTNTDQEGSNCCRQLLRKEPSV